MGTDIHLQVQGKNKDGKWEWVKRPPFKTWRVDRDDFDFDADPTGRDYNLFAILAGVRNGYGFAGTYRHEPVSPWFEGRGLPDGMTDEDCERVDDSVPAYGDDWIGDHSFTHATLAELRAAPWDHEFHQFGVVNPQNFKVWREKGMPDEWSGGIMGRDIVTHTDPDEYGRMVDGGLIRVDNRNPKWSRTLDYCRVTWKWAPLTDCTFRKWIDGDVMQSIADEYGGPENVRVLMGFDS